MPPDTKHKHECKGVWLTTYVLQGSVATNLRGGDSFNASFLRRSILKLRVKKKLWKLIHYCRNNRENKSGTHFLRHG